MRLIAAVDIGGTKTAAGIVDAHSRVLVRRSAPTPASDGPAAVLAVAARLIREVTAEAGADLVAVGVGTAGVVDPATGTVVAATCAMPGWAGTPVAARLAADLDRPVHVENDVTAFRLGEVAAGAAAGFDDVIAIAVGTGVGGALLVNGKPVRGSTCVAGNVGHVPSPEAGTRRCPCGRRGHLKAFSSGPAMAAIYAERSGRTVADLHEVAERAANGDELARTVLRAGATAVGRVAGGLANVLDPQLILLGGGVVGLGTWYVDAVAQAVFGELLEPSTVQLRAAALGGDAMLVGAAAPARAAVGVP